MATNGNSRPCLRDLEENDAESALIPTVPNAVPYQYEPRRPTAPVIAYETDSDVTSDSESEEDLNARVGNTEWCECGECVPMEKPETSFCCRERGIIFNLAHDLGLDCITQHPGYDGNCLNEYVVETSFYEFLEGYGHVGDDEPIHKLYRHVACRRFTRWVWRRLGRGVRKPIPSCATHKIRQQWPDQQYTGFKYVTDL